MWDGIAADDRAVLASEMCRTGFADQVICMHICIYTYIYVYVYIYKYIYIYRVNPIYIY